MLQSQAQRLSQDYPTAQVSDLMGRAIAEQLPDIIQSADERNLSLADLKALTSQEIIVNGENIWDVANQQGKSLRLRLKEAIQAAGKNDGRVVGMATQRALVQAKNGDIDGAIDTITSAGLSVRSGQRPDDHVRLRTIARLHTTNVQEAKQMEFWNRNVQGETWKDMWPEIVEAGKDQSIKSQALSLALVRKIMSRAIPVAARRHLPSTPPTASSFKGVRWVCGERRLECRRQDWGQFRQRS